MWHQKELQEYLKQKLSAKRFTHSMNVAEASAALARRYGGVEIEKARFAGMVHDICKEESRDVQYTLMMQSSLAVCEAERKAFKVWHGIAGAELLRSEFGITDPDILHAVRYHTVGRAGMSQLEQIVYLADAISAERRYPEVYTMRRKSQESLAAGMCFALRFSIEKLVHKEALIPHHTIEAYNENLTKLQEG